MAEQCAKQISIAIPFKLRQELRKRVREASDTQEEAQEVADRLIAKAIGDVLLLPELDPATRKPGKLANECNMHTDCAAASDAAAEKGHGIAHCWDAYCNDCFGY